MVQVERFQSKIGLAVGGSLGYVYSAVSHRLMCCHIIHVAADVDLGRHDVGDIGRGENGVIWIHHFMQAN